jgi:hypothetical protein
LLVPQAGQSTVHENGIVVGNGPLDVVRVDLFQAFNEVQLVAVFMAGGVQPTAFIDSDGIDNERVAFPVTDGMSHKFRVIHDFRRMWAAVHIDHSVNSLVLV